MVKKLFKIDPVEILQREKAEAMLKNWEYKDVFHSALTVLIFLMVLITIVSGFISTAQFVYEGVVDYSFFWKALAATLIGVASMIFHFERYSFQECSNDEYEEITEFKKNHPQINDYVEKVYESGRTWLSNFEYNEIVETNEFLNGKKKHEEIKAKVFSKGNEKLITYMSDELHQLLMDNSELLSMDIRAAIAVGVPITFSLDASLNTDLPLPSTSTGIETNKEICNL